MKDTGKKMKKREDTSGKKAERSKKQKTEGKRSVSLKIRSTLSSRLGTALGTDTRRGAEFKCFKTRKKGVQRGGEVASAFLEKKTGLYWFKKRCVGRIMTGEETGGDQRGEPKGRGADLYFEKVRRKKNKDLSQPPLYHTPGFSKATGEDVDRRGVPARGGNEYSGKGKEEVGSLGLTGAW